MPYHLNKKCVMRAHSSLQNQASEQRMWQKGCHCIIPKWGKFYFKSTAEKDKIWNSSVQKTVTFLNMKERFKLSCPTAGYIERSRHNEQQCCHTTTHICVSFCWPSSTNGIQTNWWLRASEHWQPPVLQDCEPFCYTRIKRWSWSIYFDWTQLTTCPKSPSERKVKKTFYTPILKRVGVLVENLKSIAYTWLECRTLFAFALVLYYYAQWLV